MPYFPDNKLVAVQTYQPASLGYLLNQACFINTMNLKFYDFQNRIANLGTSINLQLPFKFNTAYGLVSSWQPIVENFNQLVCDQSANTSIALNTQERIFNFDYSAQEFTMQLAKGAVASFGNSIESNFALNTISGVTNNIEGSPDYGTFNTYSGPFRFFGDGVTNISSFPQMARMVTDYKNFGCVPTGLKVYIPDTASSDIVTTGLQAFTPDRGNQTAESWRVGSFGTPLVNFYQSNLLPDHIAGNVGVNGQVLTLVSVNDPSGQAVTQATFSGATANDVMALVNGDLLQCEDSSSYPRVRYLTYINNGRTASVNKLQVRVTDRVVVADGSGNVTVDFYPAISWVGIQNYRINVPLQPGMTFSVKPSHKGGVIVADDSFYGAMPPMPSSDPFPSSSKYDENTGASVRLTYSIIPGKNEYGFIYDAVWGACLLPLNSMRILFPMY